jgi:hypothetical protein
VNLRDANTAEWWWTIKGQQMTKPEPIAVTGLTSRANDEWRARGNHNYISDPHFDVAIFTASPELLVRDVMRVFGALQSVRRDWQKRSGMSSMMRGGWYDDDYQTVKHPVFNSSFALASP